MARRALRPVLIGVPLVFALWGAGMLVLTWFQQPGRPVAVFARSGMEGALVSVIAADGYILQVRGGAVIAISDKPGFVQRLYRSGAFLVIAASAGGCIVAPSGPVTVRKPAVIAIPSV